jgi:hypothetical protein
MEALSDPRFGEIYARARQIRSELAVDDLERIKRRVLDGTLDPDRARVAADLIKWPASKLIPHKYGDRIHEMRRAGREPVTVWVLPSTANDMRALWKEVGAFDGKLPLGVAGVLMKEGSTGGKDYVFEYFDTKRDEANARELKDPIFSFRDNPLAGTH